MPSLLQLVESLEDPDVRLDDNSDYRLNLSSLGILYASVVVSAGINRSPGRAKLKSDSVNPQYEEILQKRFQHHTRNILRDGLSQLRLREFTAETLVLGINDSYDSSLFFSDSLEYHVAKLASDGSFEKIGSIFKKSAWFCDQDAKVIGKTTNYPLTKEYESIQKEFQNQ